MLERQTAKDGMSTFRIRDSRGFTLVELLVVISIIALLVAILLPSLTKARKQAKQVVCLSNMKAMGTGVMSYASEYGGYLPGPVHPAVYRYQNKEMYDEHVGGTDEWKNYMRGRQLTSLLRTSFSDKSTTSGGATDKVTTCPTLAGIVPDKHFENYAKSPDGHWVFPTHYVLNNFGSESVDANDTQGPVGNPRITVPSQYFGYSPPNVNRVGQTPPRALAAIKRTSDEWAIADAWYRPRANVSLGFLQQEGPYQVAWSGEVLPNFAPHMRRGSSSYIFSDSDARSDQSSRIRTTKADGTTPTVFLDSHAAPMKSKTATLGGFKLMYGFPGTVNPDFQTDNDKTYWNRIAWE